LPKREKKNIQNTLQNKNSIGKERTIIGLSQDNAQVKLLNHKAQA